MSERGYEIYCKVTRAINQVLYENLKDESDETKDYVEQRLLDEYRPWHYMDRRIENVNMEGE